MLSRSKIVNSSLALLSLASFTMSKDIAKAVEVDPKSPELSELININPDRPEDTPWETNVVPNDNCAAVALGGGVFITAAHLDTPRGAQRVEYFPFDGVLECDLVIYYLPFTKDKFSRLNISKERLTKDETIVISGFGGQEPGVVGAGLQTYVKNGAFGTVTKAYPHEYASDVFFAKTHQLHVATTSEGDSGGGVFRYSSKNKEWQLSGILIAKMNPDHDDPRQSVAVDLSNAAIYNAIEAYREEIINNPPRLFDYDNLIPKSALLGLSALVLARRRKKK